MKRKFCDPLLLPQYSWETNKAVPEAFAIISEEAPHSEETRLNLNSGQKSKSHTRTEDQLLF
jgi:hypothetical protein